MKIVAAIEEATELLRSEGLDINQLTVDEQLLIPYTLFTTAQPAPACSS
jgi:hypothetical protein